MNAHSKAVADLIFIAARTPPDAARQNPDPVDDLATLIGREQAEKIRHLNLGALAMMTAGEMRKNGLSAAAAGTLRAAFKLAIKAAHEALLPASAKISSPKDVDALMRDRMALLPHEEVWALYLNASKNVKADVLITKMGFDFAAVDSRVIFAEALEVRAHAFILVHNHPSGNPEPSMPDRELSKRLAEQGKIMSIPLLDHVIIVRGGFSSLAERGAIP